MSVVRGRPRWAAEPADRPDHLAAAFGPGLVGGITGQIAALVVGQADQIQRTDPLLHIDVHHHRVVLPIAHAACVGCQWFEPAATGRLVLARDTGGSDQPPTTWDHPAK